MNPGVTTDDFRIQSGGRADSADFENKLPF
jgi:hypothetical protein